MTESTLILGCLVAFTVGTVLAALIMQQRAARLVAQARAASAAELGAARARASMVEPLETKVATLENLLSGATEQATTQREAMARIQAELRSEREQFAERLAFAEDARGSLAEQFRNLANDILEEKGKRFAEQNQDNLGTLLNPLREKLVEFQAKVEDVYVKEGKDRTALAEQVRQLMGLNQVLSEDAKSLTSALKGSNKAQGNWGELVLERVLESSGLREGHEYLVQPSHTQEDGRRLQPDVVVNLPRGRSLVVDSKMSLTAYEAFVSAEDDAPREAALKSHIASVRTHIRSLQGKQYQAMYQLETLDFVLMFVPIEPAFMAAVNHGENLFKEAWDNGVLLVSPSTLVFVLRTVDYLWRQEAQTRNAQDIAKRGGELYDRLCDFAKELEDVGDRLRQAQNSFDKAKGKLAHNKGCVIRQAEMLRDLGVKPKKSLPKSFLPAADNDEAGGADGDAADRENSLAAPSAQAS